MLAAHSESAAQPLVPRPWEVSVLHSVYLHGRSTELKAIFTRQRKALESRIEA